MKKTIALLVGLLASVQLSQAQSVMDLAASAQCDAQDNILKPIIKSSEHEKRGVKASTWVRLAEAYANHTTACGKDSTSAIKAWDALKKAKELDSDGASAADIDALMHGELMYSAIMNQGVAHYNVNNLETAAKLFMIGTVVDPKDTLASFYAGIVSNQLEDYDNAEKAFKGYIETAGGRDPASYYTISQIRKEKGDLEGAIEWLKKGVADTDNKDLRGELINTYIQNDRLKEAIADLEKLVQMDANNSNTWLNLGLLYDNNDQKDKAMEAYMKALALEPDNFDANFSIGVLHFNEAVKIKNEVDAMDMKTYQAKGKEIETKACEKFNMAKPYFEKCESVRPGDEDVKASLENLGRVLAQCK